MLDMFFSCASRLMLNPLKQEQNRKGRNRAKLNSRIRVERGVALNALAIAEMSLWAGMVSQDQCIEDGEEWADHTD